jgi:chemotaxis protein MotB
MSGSQELVTGVINRHNLASGEQPDMQNPWRAVRQSTVDGPKDQEYWLSYSDLMAGLLMVFVLMLLAALYVHNQQVTTTRTGLDRIEAGLAWGDSLHAWIEQADVPAEIDPETGLIRLSDDNNVLFAENSDVLAPEGEAVIARFAQGLLPLILRQEIFRSHLEHVVVEGHTNTNGTFEYNIGLSQRRAYSVMTHILEYAPPEHADELQRFMTANGRSFSWPVCTDGQVRFHLECDGIDDARSRRIEIQFRLNSQAIVSQIRDVLQAFP